MCVMGSCNGVSNGAKMGPGLISCHFSSVLVRPSHLSPVQFDQHILIKLFTLGTCWQQLHDWILLGMNMTTSLVGFTKGNFLFCGTSEKNRDTRLSCPWLYAFQRPYRLPPWPIPGEWSVSDWYTVFKKKYLIVKIFQGSRQYLGKYFQNVNYPT